MAVYIAVFAVVVVGLVLAWRGLGAHASITSAPLDVGALAGTLRTVLDLLQASGTLPGAAPQRGRKLAAAISLRLAQAAPSAEAEAAAAALLSAAADDCGWAARLQESAGYPTNPGLQAAVAALLSHAGRCLESLPQGGEEPAATAAPTAPPVH